MDHYHLFDFGKMRVWDIKSDNKVYKGIESHCHKECEIFYMVDGGFDICISGSRAGGGEGLCVSCHFR